MGKKYDNESRLLNRHGICFICGSDLGRAKSVCDKCADGILVAGREKAAVEKAAAEKAAAQKAAAQKEAEKSSPLLGASELAAKQHFSLHQRWGTNFVAKPCEGNVLLVEVTTTFFDARPNAVFVLRGGGKNVHAGKGGQVLK
jgi:hypothetical protein